MRLTLLALLLVCIAGPLKSQTDDWGTVPEAVRADMMTGSWDDALAKLDALVTAKPEEKDLWLLLRGVALDQAGHHEEALAALRRIETDMPESRLVFKARFRQAEIHRARGEYEQAETIYEDAVRILRSSERQGELAQVYLDHADEASTPPTVVTPGHRLDYNRAHDLYAKVLELEVSRELEDRARFRMAVCRSKAGQHDQARQAFTSYLDHFDPTRQKPLPAGFVQGMQIWEARLQLGLSEFHSGRAAFARRTFEDFASDLTDAIDGGEVEVEKRTMVGEALYQLALTYGSGGDASRLASAAHERFLESFPHHKRATVAAMAIAGHELQLGRIEPAAAAYRRAASTTAPASLDHDAEAMAEYERLIKQALYSEGRAYFIGQEYVAAIERYTNYTRRYPNGPDWAAAQQGIVDAQYEIGQKHRRAERFDEAAQAWMEFLQAHPLDHRAPAIAYDLGQIEVERADAILRDDAQADVSLALRAAVDQWSRVAGQYPGSDRASHALFQSGLILETRLEELELAIEKYRECNFGAAAGASHGRLLELTEPALSLVTERTMRTTEAAKVKMQLRNVDEVRVELYSLDLEAYFKKHLTHREVESLDLDLIAPDKSFELPIEDYQEYAPLERFVDLGVDGPGVWAVAVTAGELRATTLVLRSDIDVIVKASRREIFVFAQDRLANAPAQGVEVLLAVPTNESPVLHEITTGADGVARLEWEELRKAGSVRVLATREGHFASDGLSLQGQSIAVGLSAKGHVSTDRTVYRPGDEIRWRGILRAVRRGAYHFRPGQRVDVVLRDSHGRPLFEERLTLSDFGTVNGKVALPEEAPLGTYNLIVRGPGLPQSTVNFQVQQYQPSPVELTLTPDRTVAYRGDEVTVVASAKYYYGSPVIDAPIVYHLPDGREHMARTDERGEIEFTFGTRDFLSDQTLGVWATLREEAVTSGTQVQLATRGYRATVATPRNVVLAGDSFEVSLVTMDAAGEPVARDMVVELLRRESVPGGRWREVRIDSRNVTTAEDGTASATFSTEEDGAVIARATGTDRFGHPILAETSLWISGDGDSQRLRLLADRSNANVGEGLSFELIHRAEPGLALLTFEGETILGYRLVQLQAGRNPFTLNLDHTHFPNIAISAAMISGNELLQASSDFRIERELRVTITPRENVIVPGDEATLDVTVTDQTGAPVKAELALAVVDASLFDLYPDHTPGLKRHFEQGTYRRAGLATTSSCTFRYDGVTTRIAAAILEEAAREQAQQEWDAKSVDMLSALGYAGGEWAEDSEALAQNKPSGPSTPGPASPAAAPRGGGDDFFLGRGRASSETRRGSVRKSKAPKKSLEARATPEFDADTAFWTPSLVTDESGNGSVTFTLPRKSTRWRVTGRGVTTETLAASATATLITRSPFFCDLRTPRLCLEGDQPRVAAEIHNLTGKGGTAKLTLTVKSGEERWFQTAQVELRAEGMSEHVFEELPALAPEDLTFELSVEAELDGAELVASATENVPVRPFGVELADAASLTLEDAATLWLELPAGRTYGSRTLELNIGASLDRILIEEALGQGPRRYSRLGGTSHSAVASELIGACAVLESMAAGTGNQPEHARVRSRASSHIASLVAAQNPDGGWSWLGRSASHPETTARVAVAFGAAKRAGIEVPANTVTITGNYLRAAHGKAAPRDLELRAALVHGLAAIGKGDFTATNSLHREKNRLSPAALAHTTLALVHLDRLPMATEVAGLLEAVVVHDASTGRARCKLDGNSAWSQSSLDMTALALLALEAALPSSPRIGEGVEELLSTRPWSASRGGGLAVAAVAAYQRETVPHDDAAVLTVTIENNTPIEIPLNRNATSHHMSLPLEGGGRRVAVRLSLEGRAAPHVAAMLTGFTRDLATGDAENHGFTVYPVTYAAEAPRFEGRKIPTGFSVLRDRSKTWVNQIEQLGLGQTTEASVTVRRGRSNEVAEDYLVLEIPLPAGTRVQSGSVRGGLGLHREEDGKLIVPLGTRMGSMGVNYTLIGTDSGQYRTGAPIVRSAYRPERISIAKGDDLRVLGRGEVSSDPYRPTPNERYHLGQWRYQTGDLAGAHADLGALHKEHGGNLRTSELQTVARILLSTSLDAGDPASAVRFFEVLREKDPSYTVPFEQIIAIGEAYRDLGEFERAYLIFRATALETFGKDLEVAGTLQNAGERAAALDVLDELTLIYPDLPSVVEARLSLADQLLTLAPSAYADPSLVDAGYDRAALTGRGIRLLGRFLSLHPTSSLSPDAGLAMVSAYLGMDDAETAARIAERMASIHTEPRYADAFTYTQAVAWWHLGQDGEAEGLLERIANAEYEDERGNKTPSENRDLALYILGQIAHARQESETAEEYYDRVDHLFSDAAEALQGFRRRHLGMDEVTTARPGETVELAMTYQNLEDAELFVYGVDLMTLYLRERNLSNVTAVNLAGIAPTLTQNVTLGAGRDLRHQEASAELALEEPGAYLVIARSGALHTSGLVLVSDLELEVAADPSNGRVRVQAMDRASGTYRRDVDVRVVGSQSQSFVSGETDPRGLFLADGAFGAATVVARDGAHYAFHRGQSQQADWGGQQLQSLGEQLDGQAYFQNVIDFNGSNVRFRADRLQQQMEKSSKGVQLDSIK